MTCDSAKELLSECADSLLEHERAVELSSHLNACKNCTRELELIRGVSKLVRSLPKRALPTGFLQRLERRRQEPEPAGPLPARALALGFTVFFVGLVIYRTARPKPVFKSAAAPLAEVAQAPQSRLGRSPARDSGFPISAGGDSIEPPPAAHITPGGEPAYSRPGSAFDNTAQAKRMQQETAEAGIQGINQQDEDAPQNEPFLGRRLGNPEVRQRAEAQIRQLVALRRAVDDGTGRPKPVPIAGQTAPVLAQNDTANGAALGDMDNSAAPATAAEPSEPWRGSYSGGNEGTRTVSDAASWQTLWHSINPETSAPRLDFTRQEVVAVFLGARPSGGYSLEITGITSSESALTVAYRERVPPPGVPPPEGTTSPYILKAIPASSLPVRFVKAP